MRKESSRRRFEVKFAVSVYWKGEPSKQIQLHTVEPGEDCIGARFEPGKEYVVFAVSQEAGDHWLGILPKNSRILTVNNFCDSTAETRLSGQSLKELGKGRKP